jgi:hypothetical protein
MLDNYDLNTNSSYLSSKVLSLYCVFEVQNLVLSLTCEFLKFLYYTIMLKLQRQILACLILLL